MRRCAICGSADIIVETKKEGYDKKKGIIGGLLLGNVGLVAGVNENTVNYYTCRSCGKTLSMTLDEFQTKQIDSMIEILNSERCGEYDLQQALKIDEKFPGILPLNKIKECQDKLNVKNQIKEEHYSYLTGEFQFDEIIKILQKEKKALTIQEIQALSEELSCVTNQRMSANLKKLIANEKVVRIEILNKVMFCLKDFENDILLDDGLSSLDGFVFEEKSEYVVLVGFNKTEYKNKDSKEIEIVIPNEFNNKPVTVIGAGAFESCEITKLYLPSSLKVIEEFAFTDNKLIELVIPNGVIEIQESAFSENNLKEISIPSSLITLGSQAFAFNQIENQDLPTTIINIGEDIFYTD